MAGLLGSTIAGLGFLVLGDEARSQRPAATARTPAVADAGEAFRIGTADLEPGPRRVVIDAAEGGEGDAAPPGLTHAARLLNVYALHGVDPEDVALTVVLHGDATAAALDHAAHRRFASGRNPHAELIARLEDAGAEIAVCGQALEHRRIPLDAALDRVEVKASAMSTVVDAQRAGAALLTY